MYNCNLETGIPYGVISCNSLPAWIWNEIDGMDCPVEREAFADYVRDCAVADADRGYVTVADFDGDQAEEDVYDLIAREDTDVLRELCERDPGDSWESDFGAFRRFGEIDGCKVSVAELGGALNFWVEFSPYIGKYRPCSPCIPGAGDLDSPDPDDGIECYDVPPEWRSGE
jgi:hypothetical protein